MATATRNKYRFKSRIEAETAYTEAEQARHIAQCALSALLAGNVAQELTRGPFTVKLLHSTNRNGWYLLVSETTTTGIIHRTHNPDEWCAFQHYRFLAHSPTQEELQLRYLAEDVKRAYYAELDK